MEPKIIVPQYEGVNNLQMEKSQERLLRTKSYRDLSTIIICPTRGTLSAKVVQCWMGLMRPMNQKVTRAALRDRHGGRGSVQFHG